MALLKFLSLIKDIKLLISGWQAIWQRGRIITLDRVLSICVMYKR